MTIKASRIICLCILIGMSAMDIKTREVPVMALAAGNIAAVLYQSIWRKEDLISIAGGTAIGVLFLVAGRLTKESIGYGDGLGIMALGIYLGLWKLLEVLSGVFFILALGSIIILCKKRMARNCTLPLYPFLTTGYVIWLAMG